MSAARRERQRNIEEKINKLSITMMNGIPVTGMLKTFIRDLLKDMKDEATDCMAEKDYQSAGAMLTDAINLKGYLIYNGYSCSSTLDKNLHLLRSECAWKMVQVENQKVKHATCECPVGADRCHHMAALLIWIEKNVSRTDVECRWTRPKPSRTDEIRAKKISKHNHGRCRGGTTRPVGESDRKWFLEQLSLMGRFTSMGWILSPEAHEVTPVKTFKNIIHSPEYAASADKVGYIQSHMRLSEEEATAIERLTVGQRHNALWFAYKQNRLTSSNFGAVLRAVRRGSTPPSLLKTLRGEYQLNSAAAIQWGQNHEATALQAYTKAVGHTVKSVGLFIMPTGILGSSPDGQVSSELLVEIKCPWTARNTSLVDLALVKKDFFLDIKPKLHSGTLQLKESHNYWHQVQGSLHIVGASACDFFIWTPEEELCIRIAKDPGWASNIPILEHFYLNVLLPSITFP